MATFKKDKRPPVDVNNVFIKFLPQDVSDDGLRQMFVSFGVISSCKVMIDQATGKSLGYGFVRFKSPAEASLAIEKMNGQKFANKRLLVKLANLSPASQYAQVSQHPSLVQQTPSNNLYIKPLLEGTSEEELRTIFAQFGNVLECKVMMDRNTGLSRQIGFVRFESEHEATDAIREMNGARLSQSSPPLHVKYADTERQKMARRSLRNQSNSSPNHSPVLQYSPGFWPGPPGGYWIPPTGMGYPPNVPPPQWAWQLNMQGYPPQMVPFNQLPHGPGGQEFPSPDGQGYAGEYMYQMTLPVYQSEDGSYLTHEQVAHQFSRLHLSDGHDGDDMFSQSPSVMGDSTEDSESSDSAIAGGEVAVR